ncbi:phospholipase A2-like [Argiope bruennichi]|uniref:Phospholipase A2 n=1 Tax=Argiope bruennichi TaxID=94029 RepID=A0A8T0FQA5_ARGBR|nr:phospholipase A2-like [Argiope bruennichi]KAF8791819.1 Phospholipase A(2) like protein [Argiope bruennichi]
MLPLFLVIFTTLCFIADGQGGDRPKGTIGDKLVSIGRNELLNLLGRSVENGNGFMPLESRQYKCHVLNALYQSARMKYPDLPKEVLSPRMINMLDNCATRDFRLSEFFSQPFIFPGTKYCGQGNIAENYHDLGIFNETDACCREHDYCDDIIRPGRTKHNLINPFGTTRLHCKCDEALRNCFRKVNSVVSNSVGYIFFSLLQTQCFDFEYPATGCLLWRRGAVRLYCVKYELQEDQPKRWQWFDQEPHF